MITFKEITTSSPDYPFVENLLHSAFPEEERRPDKQQRENTDNLPEFHCFAIYSGSRIVGFITWWQLEDFRYAEHFAIDPNQRNGGLGAKALTAFLALSPSPLVLEVEPESYSQMAARRIEFYKRSGLRLWTSDYLQPPYRPSGESVPLKLMATSGLDEEEDYLRVRNLIHKRVYGVN